jgi:hypothetical protein
MKHTEFLNIDIEVISNKGFSLFKTYINENAIILNENEVEIVFEINNTFDSPNDGFSKIIEFIDKFDENLKSEWNRFDYKTLNIGIQAGEFPYSANFDLSTEAINLMCRHNLQLKLCIYASNDGN